MSTENTIRTFTAGDAYLEYATPSDFAIVWTGAEGPDTVVYDSDINVTRHPELITLPDVEALTEALAYLNDEKDPVTAWTFNKVEEALENFLDGAPQSVRDYAASAFQPVYSEDDPSSDFETISSHGLTGGISGHIYTYDISQRLESRRFDVFAWLDRRWKEETDESLYTTFPGLHLIQRDDPDVTTADCLAVFMAGEDSDDLEVSYDMVLSMVNSFFMESAAYEVLCMLENEPCPFEETTEATN